MIRCLQIRNNNNKINMDKKYYQPLWDIARLPVGWKYTDGLTYPLTLVKTDGKRLTFKNYDQHHEFIKNTFRK